MRHDNLNIVLGPPGTGKTTWLLNLVEQLLVGGVAPNRIAFLTFTKKAANEARERAAKRFTLTSDDLPWFRTIHSLVFARLGLSTRQVVKNSDLIELSKILGIDFQGAISLDEEGVVSVAAKGDKMVFLENLARATGKGLLHVWEEHDHGLGHDANRGVSFAELQMFAKAYAKFKTVRGLVDYTDMLELFAQEPRLAPRLDVLIVDEAQDLSQAQWRAIHVIAANTPMVHVAGDDDQAIYRWAGADVDQFMTLEGTVRILDQSFRIPAAVHEVANHLLSRISVRRDKQFKPREVRGAVSYVNSSEEIDMSSGSWLLLARHIYQLSEYERICRDKGWSYEVKGRSFTNSADISAILAWETLRKGERITAAAAMAVYRKMRLNVTSAGRRALGKLPNDDAVTLTELQATFGLKTTAIWHEAFDAMPYAQKDFYIRARKQGERLTSEPRIKISTIHGAKGGQADHVVVGTDISEMADANMQRGSEDETRVFYVGCTRAKETLTIVQPRTRLFYDV